MAEHHTDPQVRAALHQVGVSEPAHHEAAAEAQRAGIDVLALIQLLQTASPALIQAIRTASPAVKAMIEAILARRRGQPQPQQQTP